MTGYRTHFKPVKKVKTVPINYTLEQLQEMAHDRWYFYNLIIMHQWHKFIYGADHTENAKIQFLRNFMKSPK